MPQILTKRLSAIALVAAFVVAVMLGFFFAQHRYQLLDGNNIDYSYFLQFTVHAFSPTLAHEMTINPYAVGEHMLFTGGYDGAPSLWDWMHVEPIKIVPAFLYSITGSLLVPYAFYIVFFFLPLLYGAYVLWRRKEQNVTLVLALIAASTYFAFLFNATDYLRPYQLLFPMFLCLVLSLAYRRPLAEKILLFVFFLLIREEAMVLGAAVLWWELLRTRRDALTERDTYVLWCIWGVGVLSTAWYVVFSGYTVTIPHHVLVLVPWLALALCLFLALVWWLWRKGTEMWPYAPDALFVFMTIIPVLYFMFGVDPHAASHGLRLIYGRYASALFYIVTAVFLAYSFDHRQNILQKRLAMYFFSLCIAVFVAYEVIPHESNMLHYITRWDTKAELDTLVYLAASTIPKDTPVLLDMTTIVAFADHDNTYAYNYLPAKLASTTGATFPENLGPLRKLISTHVPYAVLDNYDAEPLLALLKQAGQKPTLLEQNSKFSFYSIK